MKKCVFLLFVLLLLLSNYAIADDAMPLETVYQSDKFVVTLPKPMYHLTTNGGLEKYYGREDKYCNDGVISIYSMEYFCSDDNFYNYVFKKHETFIDDSLITKREKIYDINNKPAIVFIYYDQNQGLIYAFGYIYNDGTLLRISYVDASYDISSTENTLVSIIEGIQYIEPQNVLSEPYTFKNVPWGTSYSELEKIFSDYDILCFKGYGMRTYTTADYTKGPFQGKRYESNNINVSADILEVEVAGYKASASFAFVYMPINGELTYSLDDTLLFAAGYTIESADVSKAEADLRSKLSSLYGKGKTTTVKGENIPKTEWFVGDEMEIVLKEGLLDDEIEINYVWLRGDEILDKAYKIEQNAAKNTEKENYGNNNTDGL